MICGFDRGMHEARDTAGRAVHCQARRMTLADACLTLIAPFLTAWWRFVIATVTVPGNHQTQTVDRETVTSLAL